MQLDIAVCLMSASSEMLDSAIACFCFLQEAVVSATCYVEGHLAVQPY